MSQYLSVNDILVSNEKVPCTFLSSLPRLGFLMSSSESEDVEAGAQVELPLWLAEALSARRSPPLVSVGLPRVYREAYREILLADAGTVDLHKLGRYFYELGCCVAKYDIKGDVGNTLVSTFRQRYRLVAEAAVCGADGGEGTTERSRRLAEGERRRAAEAAAAARALAGWLRCGASVLRTADMVSSHRKRKRNEMEMIANASHVLLPAVMALSPFFYDMYRPSRLLDQQFGLGLTPDELVLPTYSSMASSYYRPWRSQAEDAGSTIDRDKDKFRVCLDVQQFRSNEITVKTTAKQIIIEGKHEERQDEHGSISRQFIRKYSLPEDCDSDDVTSSLTADGVLIVEAKKRISRMLKDKERVVPIDKIAAVCQKNGSCKKGTAQNIKESMHNKMMEEKEVSTMNSKQAMDLNSKDMLSKMKDESLCAMNAKQKCDNMMNSQKSDSFKDDFKMKGAAAKEERCSLLNADGTLKFSTESSTEALRAAKASSMQERVDFSSTSMTSETVQSKESSFSSTEMSCGFRSGDAKVDFISDIINAELKAAENL